MKAWLAGLRARRSWKFMLVAVLTALLTWLFVKAGEVSPGSHDAYTQQLRLFQ